MQNSTKLEKNFSEMQFPTDTIDTEGAPEKSSRHPFIISEIVDHMFKFLQLTDLKNCRLVCHQWGDLGKTHLGKVCLFKFCEWSLDKCVSEFNDVFPNAKNSRSAFTHVQIEKTFGERIKLDKFLECLQLWGNELKELRIKLSIVGPFEKLHIVPHLPVTLTKIEIDSELLYVRLEEIVHLRVLRLRNCICTMDTFLGVCLTPVEIELTNVAFEVQGVRNNNFLLNNLFDFEKLSKAKFDIKNAILDMGGIYSFDSLTLGEVRILNWEVSGWKVHNLLEISKHSLLQSNMMEYKNLSVKDSTIDLSILPKENEKLTLSLKNPDSIRVYAFLNNLSNLKYLSIDGVVTCGGDISEYLVHFKQCKNLKYLDLPGKYSYILKTSSIPENVTKIRIGTPVQICIDERFDLNMLILCEYICTNISDIMEQLNVEHLVWELYSKNKENSIFNDELKNEIMNLISLDLESFVVGPLIQLSELEFQNSCLFNLVDDQGKYYLFKNEKGKAITDSEFNDLKKI